ncbi:hypothetical protein MYX04_12695 [Nitrospiraceae bacterium AH_259_D15_M11_P09]|nr:hypothetical protein [Nitrospiraceae bacterium AH_259_D15_M11_P09]
MIAPLQLKSYIVKELSYKLNTDCRPKAGETLESVVGVGFDIKGHKTEKGRYLMSMVIDVNKNPTIFKRNPYQISMRLFGKFMLEKDVDEQTGTKLLFNNGSSILYGIARGAVANITGSLGTVRYILPTVNLLAAIERKFAKPEAVRRRKKRKLSTQQK